MMKLAALSCIAQRLRSKSVTSGEVRSTSVNQPANRARVSSRRRKSPAAVLESSTGNTQAENIKTKAVRRKRMTTIPETSSDCIALRLRSTTRNRPNPPRQEPVVVQPSTSSQEELTSPASLRITNTKTVAWEEHDGLDHPLGPSLSSALDNKTTSLEPLRWEATENEKCLPINNLASVTVSEPTTEETKTGEAGTSTALADTNTKNEPVYDDGVDEGSAELSVAGDDGKTTAGLCQPLQQPKASKTQYVTGWSRSRP
ncbi:uncharacterized protein LOC131268910 [Anopheles coustani]|uniref:uncharacterized protein LOC131268910 n=1 Tax=Anopheles coustani TaxID=139045 RepID=UPI00265A98C5|nr:uncharacterized protein LOC131268910 [Anopheles coustani]